MCYFRVGIFTSPYANPPILAIRQSPNLLPLDHYPSPSIFREPYPLSVLQESNFKEFNCSISTSIQYPISNQWFCPVLNGATSHSFLLLLIFFNPKIRDTPKIPVLCGACLKHMHLTGAQSKFLFGVSAFFGEDRLAW
jgi:hypothetical protein